MVLRGHGGRDWRRGCHIIDHTDALDRYLLAVEALVILGGPISWFYGHRWDVLPIESTESTTQLGVINDTHVLCSRFLRDHLLGKARITVASRH